MHKNQNMRKLWLMPKSTVVVLPTHKLFFEVVKSALKDHPVTMEGGSTSSDIQIIFDDLQGYLLWQLEKLQPHPKRIFLAITPAQNT
jgi:hypothetical protein